MSDSRPEDWSFVEGLGFLPYSNCPHYSQEVRRERYDDLIRRKKIGPGYAFDERAGILLVNGKAEKFITQSDRPHVYYASRCKNRVAVEEQDAELLIAEDALPEGAYESIEVGRKIREIEKDGSSMPLSAYVAIVREMARKSRSYLDSSVNKIFLFQDEIAGVVNDKYLDSMGFTDYGTFIIGTGFGKKRAKILEAGWFSRVKLHSGKRS